MTDTRALRAIAALREPDHSLASVPNTVRQSIAEVIEDQQTAMIEAVAKSVDSALASGAPGLAPVVKDAIRNNVILRLRHQFNVPAPPLENRPLP